MNDTNKQAVCPQSILQDLLNTCLAAGANAADASFTQAEGVHVDVRQGRLESVGRSESRGVALRCLFGQRQATISGSDVTATGLAQMAERCIAMARTLPEDPYCGLTPSEELATDFPDLDLSGMGEIDMAKLEADALAAEAAALDVEQVSQVSDCGAGWSRREHWVAASNGFSACRLGETTGIGLAAIAGHGDAMERDHDGWNVRRLEDRPSASSIGKTAGLRAAARLNPRRVETQKAAVIYDRRVADSLLHTFLSAIGGPGVARGISFLKDRLGQPVFARGVNVVDDPFRPRGMGSRAHDGEGRPVARVALVEDGVLTRWLLNGASARQLGLSPNGHAQGGFGHIPGVGVSNACLEPGCQSPEELRRSAGRGLIVTDMFSPSINPNTGDYSVGVAGFWFENGEICHPVCEVTVADNLPDMFARLVPASDLELRGAVDAPSILVEDMAIAGKQGHG